MTTHGSRGHLGLAILALGSVIAFAALGGTSLAGGVAKKPKPAKTQHAQDENGENSTKVTVCHKAKVTIRVGAPAVEAHKAHGDVLAACASTSQAKPKKAKKD